MSPRTAAKPPTPAATNLVGRVAVAIGAGLREERQRRRWTVEQAAERARVARGTVSGIEAGRPASLLTYARLALALGLSLDVDLGGRQRRQARGPKDFVHAAMGELEATWLTDLGYRVSIDQPYQHYQFAGRADLLAWTPDGPALLHIENRTGFPDLQQAAGSYNAKREYLANAVARRLGIRRFASETHVMMGLWSSEVLHTLCLRPATFRALCPDSSARLGRWFSGDPPMSGRSSSFVLLDPLASRRQASIVGLERAVGGVRPRVRDYREAAERLRRPGVSVARPTLGRPGRRSGDRADARETGPTLIGEDGAPIDSTRTVHERGKRID